MSAIQPQYREERMADKSRGLFDHLKQVKKHKRDGYWDSLTKEEKKAWSSWMCHRFISMEPDYLPIVNEVQHLTLDLDDETCYRFWKDLLPKDPRYATYIKADKGGESVPDFVLDRLVEYHACSQREAREYLDVMVASDDGLDALAETVRKFALEPKEDKELTKFIDKRRG